MKKILSSVFLLLSLLGLFGFLSIDNTTVKGIRKLEAYIVKNKNDIAINWYYDQSSDSYYLFIPGDVDLNDVEIRYDASAEVICNQSLNKEGQYHLACDGQEYHLTICQNAAIPSIFIDTASGKIPEVKDCKEENALFALYNQGEVEYYQLDWLKVRGESSSSLPKKPFTIEFSKKVDLFEMGAEKRYILTANHFYDPTLLKNKFAYDLARETDIAFTTDAEYVDLYLNGDYWGNYLLCEPVEVNEHRVNITDLAELNKKANKTKYDENYDTSDNDQDLNARLWTDLENEPNDISGGYIIEAEVQDRFTGDPEPSGFSSARGQCMLLKSPKYASKNEVEYIANIYQDFEDAICSSDGYNKKGQYYSELIDLDSMAKVYIMQELSCDSDSALISFFYYKDQDDDQLHMGPIWDYDRAFGSEEGIRLGVNMKESDNWWANLNYYWHKYDQQPKYLRNIFYYAWQHEDFRELVSTYWNELYLPILSNSTQEIQELASYLDSSIYNNYLRWPINNLTANDNIKDNYQAYLSDFIRFVSERTTILTKAFNENCPPGIIYINNLDPGYTDQRKIVTVGEEVRISDYYYEDDEHHFLYWNTTEDGKGISYYPGDEYTIKEEPLYLYAIYDE